MRWSFWAAKESAFKAARQIDPGVRFIPRDFAVRRCGDRGQVLHRTGRFNVWFDFSESWLHVAASDSVVKPNIRVAGSDGTDSSDQVRRLARTAVGASSRLKASEIGIHAVDRIPRLVRGDELLPFELSMSHDGGFVACAWKHGCPAGTGELPAG
jgi:hypothetical protein